MVVWIDGTFGVGKTALAYNLQGYYGNESIVLESDILFQREMKKLFDNSPQNGFPCINGLFPQDNVSFLETFKNEINENIARYKIVIVDMALTTEHSRDMLLKPLTDAHDDILHFVLEANKDTLRERVLQQKERDASYALSVFDDSVNFLQHNYDDAIRVDTILKDEIEVRNTVVEIIEKTMLINAKGGLNERTQTTCQ